jgi:hypothetical protein
MFISMIWFHWCGNFVKNIYGDWLENKSKEIEELIFIWQSLSGKINKNAWEQIDCIIIEQG